MEREIIDIELFSSLMEIRYGNVNFDLHNQFDCFEIIKVNRNKEMTFSFKHLADEKIIRLTFTKVEIVDLFWESEDTEYNSTVDSAYRGRYENAHILFDKKGDLGYIYIEFVGGFKLEFFSKSLIVNYE